MRWRRGEEIIIIKIIKYVEYSVIESLRKKTKHEPVHIIFIVRNDMPHIVPKIVQSAPVLRYV